MKRPDIEAALRPLKPFQRRTVDHAFEQLFLRPGASGRFLVADEVGLGKTLVARGIIARTIEHLWESVDRIDIVYICSSQNIGTANLPKLRVGGDSGQSFAMSTRLTMLATDLAANGTHQGLSSSKLNFVSFTPSTSFKLGRSNGMKSEREVLFHLLDGIIDERTGLMNLLQGYIGKTEEWRYRLNKGPLPIEPAIAKAFRKAMRRPAMRRRINEVIEKWFLRRRESYPKEARQAQNALVGELRHALAKVCVDALQPDLVILDEFQRFKSLLEVDEDRADDAAELAQSLFEAVTPEGEKVRTLLLSATPYKLYTADAEIETDDHYQDFLATTRFLLGGDLEREAALKQHLGTFARALKQAGHQGPGPVVAAKRDVEEILRSVMARTERIPASADRGAMVAEPQVRVSVEPGDIRQYLAADALFQAVGDRDPMPFWKSAPYLLHFMRGYRFDARLQETLQTDPDRIDKVHAQHPQAILPMKAIEEWREIDPANGKLRDLVHTLLDGGIWKLLWIPPTLPYWPLAGAYQGQDGLTKSLVFSAWNVVPDVVSAVLSYEAERRMLGGSMENYQDPDRQQSPLLRLSQSADGHRSRHRLLLLLLPCLTLADNAHPLSAPAGQDRRAWVRSRVETMLDASHLPNPMEGPVDDRWVPLALLALDPEMGTFLERWRDASPDEIGKPNPELFGAYIDELLAHDIATLGRRPDGLIELVTDLAMGAPGVLACRMLAMAGIADEARRELAVHLANAFWKLFNRPAVIRLLQQLGGGGHDSDDGDQAYWRLVLGYCIDGNLQAVLDEAWHLAWEQHAWADSDSLETVSRRCIQQLAEAVEPRPSRVHARFYAPGERKGRNKSDEVRIRTVLALRYGHTTDEEGAASQDAVRAAFNSPFRPFVLASTSIGQEGLDFHPWCHRLVHWNLPGNPVDLEQREGRVHRFKGHAVRKNVACEHGLAALNAWKPGDDLWSRSFDLANSEARGKQESDLIPWWMAPGPHRVERYVPTLPYSAEVEGFQRLKRQLAAYRVVFGQPRQEELLALLEHSELDAGELGQWAIDLAP